MTLQEYLTQQDPVRMPHVSLQPREYVQGHFFGAPGRKIAEVFIHEIGYSYCVHQGDTRLYTIDRDGKPKSPSCFYLS